MSKGNIFAGVLQRAMTRIDGWANVLTGIGLAGRDKRFGTMVVSPPMMTREEQEAIWESSDMAARIVEVWPEEMTREGWTLSIQDDPSGQAAELLTGQMEALEVHSDIKRALEWERAYGGAAILIGADDGHTDLSQPMNEDALKSINWLTVMASYELHPVAYYSNPQAPKFGRPMMYQIHPDAPAISDVGTMFVLVHESRIIHFPGVIISRRQQRRNNGWGNSVFVRCNEVMRDFDQTWGAAGILMQDFAQGVLKIEGLAQLISTDRDDVVVERVKMIDMQRSVARMVLLDANEDFERKVTPLTGFPDMMDKFAVRLAAAADMPVTRLMGISPAGLNATGASDIRSFYDRVAAKQRSHLQPRLKRLYELMMKCKGSPTGGKVPKNWSISFEQLWQLTDVERSQVRLNMAQADNAYIMNQTVSPEEVAESRFGGDGFSMETHVDLSARRALGSAAVPSEDEKERDAPVKEPTPAETRLSPAGGNMTGGINGGPT